MSSPLDTSAVWHAGGIRAVTHFDVTKEDCLRFTEVLQTALKTA